MLNWVTAPSHHQWLSSHASGLLTFGRQCPMPGGGAWWLDDDGRPDESQGLHTWIAARMTHVYGIGSLLGVPGSGPIAAAAMAGLTGPLHDDEHGGWYSSIDSDGVVAAGKSCYEHAFVLLAASTAMHAEIDGAAELLAEASTTFLDRFWDEETGRCVDVWDTAFKTIDPYRGLNANMHAVEAMLSVAGVTGDPAWLGRADRISRFVIGMAADNRWRIPEHYDHQWEPMLAYNRDDPANQFKPYGATVGHAFEWSRLLVHLANAPIDFDREPLVDAAVQLFDNAVRDGWARNGQDGFVYTTDWDGTPVADDRLHWVLAEAIAAAAVLHRETGEDSYAVSYRQWWDHAARYHVDVDGSWRHQLDPYNRPARTVWQGRPDLYHAFQAAVIPTLPRYPMIAAALAQSVARTASSKQKP